MASAAPSAAAPVPAAAASDANIRSVIQDPARLSVPAGSMTLQSSHRGDNRRFIIHIQDPHSNFSGQRNLAAGLDEMMERYGIGTVLVEGADRDVTLTDLKPEASPDAWKRAAYKFLLQAKISGEEYLNLTSDKPMRILGIEEGGLYLQALESYAAIVREREEALAYLRRIRISMDRVKNRLYPRELLRLESADTGSEGVSERVERILVLARETGVELSDLTEIARADALKTVEKSIDFDRAGAEQSAFESALRAAALREPVQKLFERRPDPRAPPQAHYAFWSEALELAAQAGVDPSRYPVLGTYFSYLGSAARLDPIRWTDETAVLEDRVYERLLKDDGLRAIRLIDRYLRLFGSACELKLSSDEYRVFRSLNRRLATESWLSVINRRLAQAGYAEDFVPSGPALDRIAPSIHRFYSLVRRRDQAFIRGVEEHFEASGSGAAFLIAGGYHTAHLTRLLRDRGYSYAVLTPAVSDTTDHGLYEQVLLADLPRRSAKDDRISVASADAQAPAGPKSGVKSTLRPVAVRSSGSRLSALRAEAARASDDRGYEEQLKALRAMSDEIERQKADVMAGIQRIFKRSEFQIEFYGLTIRAQTAFLRNYAGYLWNGPARKFAAFVDRGAADIVRWATRGSEGAERWYHQAKIGVYQRLTPFVHSRLLRSWARSHGPFGDTPSERIRSIDRIGVEESADPISVLDPLVHTLVSDPHNHARAAAARAIGRVADPTASTAGIHAIAIGAVAHYAKDTAIDASSATVRSAASEAVQELQTRYVEAKVQGASAARMAAWSNEHGWRPELGRVQLRSTDDFEDYRKNFEVLEAFCNGFLAHFSKGDVAAMLSDPSGRALKGDDLTGDIKLVHHRDGTHKMVFKAIFRFKEGSTRQMILPVVKSEIGEKEGEEHITPREIFYTRELSGKTSHTPRYLMDFEYDGRNYIIEEYIPGLTAYEIAAARKERSLPRAERVLIVQALLRIVAQMREDTVERYKGDAVKPVMSKDIHKKNFIIRDLKGGSRRAVFVDMGGRYYYKVEDILLAIVKQYGYFGAETELPEADNNFIYDTYLEMFGERGLEVLSSTVDSIRSKRAVELSSLRLAPPRSAPSRSKRQLRIDRMEPELTGEDIDRIIGELDRYIARHAATGARMSEEERVEANLRLLRGPELDRAWEASRAEMSGGEWERRIYLTVNSEGSIISAGTTVGDPAEAARAGAATIVVRGLDPIGGGTRKIHPFYSGGGTERWLLPGGPYSESAERVLIHTFSKFNAWSREGNDPLTRDLGERFVDAVLTEFGDEGFWLEEPGIDDRIREAIRSGKTLLIDWRRIGGKEVGPRDIRGIADGAGADIAAAIRSAASRPAAPNFGRDTLAFLISEMLRNGLVHGNRMDLTLPLALRVQMDETAGRVVQIRVLDAASSLPVLGADRDRSIYLGLSGLGEFTDHIRGFGWDVTGRRRVSGDLGTGGLWLGDYSAVFDPTHWDTPFGAGSRMSEFESAERDSIVWRSLDHTPGSLLDVFDDLGAILMILPELKRDPALAAERAAIDEVLDAFDEYRHEVGGVLKQVLGPGGIDRSDVTRQLLRLRRDRPAAIASLVELHRERLDRLLTLTADPTSAIYLEDLSEHQNRMVQKLRSRAWLLDPAAAGSEFDPVDAFQTAVAATLGDVKALEFRRPEATRVRGDELAAASAFANLINNAMRETKLRGRPHGDIRISWTIEGDGTSDIRRHKIEIRNPGAFPEESLGPDTADPSLPRQKVFALDFSRSEGGTGLGTTEAYYVFEKGMGGRIEVFNDTGSGEAVVTVRIPVSAGARMGVGRPVSEELTDRIERAVREWREREPSTVTREMLDREVAAIAEAARTRLDAAGQEAWRYFEERALAWGAADAARAGNFKRILEKMVQTLSGLSDSSDPAGYLNAQVTRERVDEAAALRERLAGGAFERAVERAIAAAVRELQDNGFKPEDHNVVSAELDPNSSAALGLATPDSDLDLVVLTREGEGDVAGFVTFLERELTRENIPLRVELARIAQVPSPGGARLSDALSGIPTVLVQGPDSADRELLDPLMARAPKGVRIVFQSVSDGISFFPYGAQEAQRQAVGGVDPAAAPRPASDPFRSAAQFLRYRGDDVAVPAAVEWDASGLWNPEARRAESLAAIAGYVRMVADAEAEWNAAGNQIRISVRLPEGAEAALRAAGQGELADRLAVMRKAYLEQSALAGAVRLSVRPARADAAQRKDVLTYQALEAEDWDRIAAGEVPSLNVVPLILQGVSAARILGAGPGVLADDHPLVRLLNHDRQQRDDRVSGREVTDALQGKAGVDLLQKVALRYLRPVRIDDFVALAARMAVMVSVSA